MKSEDLSRKACFVSGGASGIGRATALALAASGARVLIADIQTFQVFR